jgi:hypothetical protein
MAEQTRRDEYDQDLHAEDAEADPERPIDVAEWNDEVHEPKPRDGVQEEHDQVHKDQRQRHQGRVAVQVRDREPG